MHRHFAFEKSHEFLSPAQTQVYTIASDREIAREKQIPKMKLCMSDQKASKMEYLITNTG